MNTTITDEWVIQYNNLKNELIKLNIPSDKIDDYDWLKQHMHSYCDANISNKILKELKSLHGY